MIPSDVVSRLQLNTDSSTRPVAAAQEISDRLSDLIPGQKLTAQIQALMPNGTYRAIISQRDITLALPFSAKPGDSLELEVVDTDGKLTLAVISRSPSQADKAAGEAASTSVSTSLSRTGQLISDLFNSVRGRSQANDGLRLNGNLPIAANPPAAASDLLPLLKQAIVQSGMFYESHQAQWVEGQYPGTALLQEPQGKLSTPSPAALARLAESAVARFFPPEGATQTPLTTLLEGAATDSPAATPMPAGTHGNEVQNQQHLPNSAVPHPEGTEKTVTQQTGTNPQTHASIDGKTATTPSPESQTAAQSSARSAAPNPAAPLIAPESVPIVQQQLESLASQQFVWQGQIWPGQEMRWEIEEDAKRRASPDETAATWQTSLHLTLPTLGELDARLRLENNRIQLDLKSGDPQTQEILRGALVLLQQQFGDAGLTLGSVGFASLMDEQNNSSSHEAPVVTSTHGQALA